MKPVNYEITLLLITILTFFLQIYVLYLIEKQSPKKMLEYRYYLKMFMGWEVAFNVMFGIVLMPYPTPPFSAMEVRGLVYYGGLQGAYVGVG
jgi:archaellum biogenesis protein FlaJ (TadC family)